MRLGVIVCPQCKQVKGMDLSSKTTKCIRCGKTLQLKKLKIYYETDSQEKLRQAIGLCTAKLEGNGDTFKKLLYDKNES
jgi:Zn ribbon nucleic-acid-binding protein